jgi:anti-anti-sigma factor
MTISWAPLKRPLFSSSARHREGDLVREPFEVAGPAPSTCRVTTRPQLGVAVFGLDGELDAATAGEVRTMLAVAVGVAAVLLDLTDVLALDTEGVEILRDVIRCVHEHGGQVAISRPRRLAPKVSALVGTEGLLFLSLSLAAAEAWLVEHPFVEPNRVALSGDTSARAEMVTRSRDR